MKILIGIIAGLFLLGVVLGLAAVKMAPEGIKMSAPYDCPQCGGSGKYHKEYEVYSCDWCKIAWTADYKQKIKWTASQKDYANDGQLTKEEVKAIPWEPP